MEGRNNDSVLALYQYFVPCVVGKKRFKAKMNEHLTKDAEICTVSDEAFALLLLENQYDRWTDIHQRKCNSSTEVRGKSERRKRKWESDVAPKYTEGGIKYSKERRMNHKGWREEGIVRFNVLSAMVKEDRVQKPKVVVGALVQWWELNNQRGRLKEPENNNLNAGTSAYHELWGDVDQESVASPQREDALEHTAV